MHFNFNNFNAHHQHIYTHIYPIWSNIFIIYIKTLWTWTHSVLPREWWNYKIYYGNGYFNFIILQTVISSFTLFHPIEWFTCSDEIQKQKQFNWKCKKKKILFFVHYFHHYYCCCLIWLIIKYRLLFLWFYSLSVVFIINICFKCMQHTVQVHFN